MNKRIILFICFFGFILRATYVVFFNAGFTFPDEERFWQEANSILNDLSLKAGDKYAHDMPITALFTALTSTLAGGSIVGVKLFFALVSAATIYFIASLAYEIYPSSYSATLAAIISSLYPFFIYFSSLLLSETLFIFFVVILFLQLLRAKEKQTWKQGVVVGLSHLTRPTLIYFYPVILIWQYLVMRLSIKYIVGGVLVFSLIIIPWGVRNLIVTGHFSLSTSGSGQALWEGNNPWNKTGGVSGNFSSTTAYLVELPEGLDEFAEDDWKKQQAIDYISNNPDKFFSLAVKKLTRIWNVWPNSYEHQDVKYKLASLFSFGLVLVFVLLAVFLFRKDYKRLSILYLFFIYYTLIHMITIGSIRYRLPIDPLLIALAAASIAKLIATIRHKNKV